MDQPQPAVDRAWERLLFEPSSYDTQYLESACQVVEWQAEKFHHDITAHNDADAHRQLVNQLEVWLSRALALLANHPLPVVHVTWSPRETIGGSYSDEASNELTAHPANNLERIEDGNFDQYFTWWHSTVSGVVTSIDPLAGTVDIRLDQPIIDCRFVRYQYDTAELDRVSLAADEFHRATTLGGCYDYEHGCRCESCLDFQKTEEAVDA